MRQLQGLALALDMITDRYMRPSPFAFRLRLRLHPQPTNQPADDILRARIQTLGVAEHVFEMNLGRKAVTWRLFDVGYVLSPYLPVSVWPCGSCWSCRGLIGQVGQQVAVKSQAPPYVVTPGGCIPSSGRSPGATPCLAGSFLAVS